MTKFLGSSVLIAILSLLLSACQSSQMIDKVRINKAGLKHQSLNTVTVYCSGAEHCEFARLNDLIITQEHGQRANRKAINKGYLKLTGEPLDRNGVYLTIPPQQYEMVIRFYPITKQHAEVFHVIHDFKANQQYTFKMYRQRTRQGSGSLLNVSAPTPLCVDMIQEKRTIRRFCRPHNAVTGVSEFIEQKI
ncbi:hypothetical protein EXE10_00525 [Acinetobacter sp. WCHAc060033]|uniref:hypothetical protein n=1 Tax=Acinetobacter TaxID=469 RepID=UPI0010238A70|nr:MULTISPECIES: hypothetical protein [Acinetobacter]RZG73501.1 hypothetical protein EXU29_07290 [Acinetobacter wuhouensis]RZG92538.1 hypothetical protein EXE10_00525 [Acinetobacter sp. WCHAc060033]